ncbi:MAG: aconitase X [Nitrososphaerales archaeon]
MHLTQNEEEALKGERGSALQMAYRVLLAVGRISGAEKLIPIKWAHLSGVSYLTIGDYGLDFLKKISNSKGSRFRVFTTVNPCGMDIQRWDEMNISSDYADKQLKINSYYEKLGIASSFTCVPFQSYKVPKKGTHVAWAESSATIFANSVLGLATNRESAASALASALTGKTVYCDLHIEKNRRPQKNIRAALGRSDLKFSGSLDFGILGYFAGKHVAGVIGFQGVKMQLSIEESKALCGAIGTVGSSGMYVIGSKEKVETIDFTKKEYDETIAELSDAESGDLIVFGCPQMTMEELYDLSRSLEGKHLRKKCVVFCSSKVYDIAKARGYLETIESAGAIFARDSCADFTPLISALGVNSVVTDSCKGAHYMKRVHGVKVSLKSPRTIIRENSD